MPTFVADLGNSRLKWGRIGGDGRIEQTFALPLDDPDGWDAAWKRWHSAGSAPGTWTIASVNPPVAERLDAFLKDRGVTTIRWFRTAAEVPISQDVENADEGGADRALAVAGALAMHPAGGPGLIVSCGTAITVERVASDRTWQGGAIAPGLGLSARALHMMTAQLPLVVPTAAPAPWGRGTLQALEAGLFWGTVGCVRELLIRQAAGLTPDPWLVWTGGDAALLAPAIEWTDARVVPYLVLEGLARLAPIP